MTNRTSSIQAGTEAVVKMWSKASNAERRELGLMHQHYEREVRRMVEEGNEPQNIAHTIHGLVDASVSNTIDNHPHGQDVQCGNHCAGCCHLHVNITYEEAVLLVGHCQNEGIDIDWHKAERQARWDFKAWNQQEPSERRCVFLGADDACRVYEHRPTACRKYMVISDPELCDSVRYPGGEVQILVPIEGEILASAALAVLESGSLPRMLQQAEGIA